MGGNKPTCLRVISCSNFAPLAAPRPAATRMLRLSLLAASLAGAAAQSLHHVSDEFELLGDASADAVLRFSAAMPMRNQAQLEAKLLDISNPLSASYGNWMTQQEVVELTGTDAGTRRDVGKWVTSTGAKCMAFPHSWRCEATVAQVNALLSTTVSAFHQKTTGKTV